MRSLCFSISWIYIYRFPCLKASCETWLTKISPFCSCIEDYFVSLLLKVKGARSRRNIKTKILMGSSFRFCQWARDNYYGPIFAIIWRSYFHIFCHMQIWPSICPKIPSSQAVLYYLERGSLCKGMMFVWLDQSRNNPCFWNEKKETQRVGPKIQNCSSMYWENLGRVVWKSPDVQEFHGYWDCSPQKEAKLYDDGKSSRSKTIHYNARNFLAFFPWGKINEIKNCSGLDRKNEQKE